MKRTIYFLQIFYLPIFFSIFLLYLGFIDPCFAQFGSNPQVRTGWARTTKATITGVHQYSEGEDVFMSETAGNIHQFGLLERDGASYYYPWKWLTDLNFDQNVLFLSSRSGNQLIIDEWTPSKYNNDYGFAPPLNIRVYISSGNELPHTHYLYFDYHGIGQLDGQLYMYNNTRMDKKLYLLQYPESGADNSNPGVPATRNLDTSVGSNFYFTCYDPDGCTITLSETGSTAGDLLYIYNDPNYYQCTFDDVANVQYVNASPVTLAPNGIITFIHSGESWQQTGLSNN